MQALAATAIVLQDNSTLISDVRSIMFAQWIIAGCILLTFLGLIAAVVAVLVIVRNLQKKVEKLSKDAQAKAMPLIGQGQDILGKVQEIVADLKPKIASVTTDVTHMTGVAKQEFDHISGVVKEQVDHISGIVHAKADEIGTTVTQWSGTVQDVNGKTNVQVQRVHGMVSDALTTTEQVSHSIQEGIKAPIIKIAGWVAAAKASIEGLAEKMPFLPQAMQPKHSPVVPPSAPAKKPGVYTGQPPIPADFPNKPKF